MGSMDGFFGGMGMEPSTGTWPTHIAQLLFSSLGAGSIGGMGERVAMSSAARRMSDANNAGALGAAEAARLASVDGPAPPRVRFSTRAQPGFASSLTGASSVGTADREPFSDFLDRVNAHRQREREQREQLQRLRENVEARTSVYSSTSVLGTSTSTFSLMPFHHTTTRTTTTTTLESSPWGTTRSSSLVTYQPITSAPLYPASNIAATTSAAVTASSSSILQNPFDSILNHQEEEEAILSTTSPNSYLQRLQREMERDTERYQFSASAPTNVTNSSSRTSFVDLSNGPALDSLPEDRSASADGLNEGSYNNWSSNSNEAGRSAETALEIDDSSDDDDVVEVVAVEAMM
jgi:hypothetical protein